MKRFLGILFVSLILSHSAMAVTTIPWTKEGCESVKGTWISAKSATDAGCDAAHCNGLNFCRSNVGLHWFSALVWCQSIGHQLVRFDHLCPGIPTNLNSTNGACANISGKSSGLAWTSMPWGNNKAIAVNLSSGTIHSSSAGNGGERHNSYDLAICEE